MVSVFYPAQSDERASRARLLDLLGPAENEILATLARTDGLSSDDLDFLRAFALRARRDLAPLPADTPRPVLIYYPGGRSHRLSNALLCELLAADGFVIFCLDAPRDAPVVVFPDGRSVFPPAPDDEDYIRPRIADIRFLLDQLAGLNATGGFANQLDPDRIGAFGNSRGGYLSTIAAVEDARIRAAANMDGFLWGLWSQDGTGLADFPPAFQEKARALEIPVLRLRGDQGGPSAAQRGFRQEAADFGGDFIGVALRGWTHDDFATTPWLCGESGRMTARIRTPPPPPGRIRCLHGLLGNFFTAALVTGASPAAAFTPPEPDADIFIRPR